MRFLNLVLPVIGLILLAFLFANEVPMAQQSAMDGDKDKKSSNNSVNVGSTIVLPPEISNDQIAQNTSTPCRWCLSPMAEKAIICLTCQGHKLWIAHYLSQVSLVLSVLITFALVIISWKSAYDTKRNKDISKEELENLSFITKANTAAVGAIHDIDELRKLWTMSRDTNEKNRVIAKKLLKPIIDQLLTDHVTINSDYWGFRDKQDPQYYGFNEMEGWKRSEYIKNYTRVPDDRRVVYVIQFLRDEKETEEEKLSFCYSAFQLESRPDVIYELCAFIDERAKLQRDYLFETGYYLTWPKERNAQSQF